MLELAPVRNFASSAGHYNRRWMCLIAIIVIVSLVPACESHVVAVADSQIIDADNIERVGSVAVVDFATLESAVGQIDNGWFALSPAGDQIAVISRSNALVILDAAGTIVGQVVVKGRDGLPATVLDAAFSPDGALLASAHTDGSAFYATTYRLRDGRMHTSLFDSHDVPLRIWLDNRYVWLEVSPFDPDEGRYVQPIEGGAGMHRLLSGPENDPDAFIRIGRVDPPLAVTVNSDGLTRRWDLATGRVTAAVKIDGLPGLGQLDASGRYLVWRDGESLSLHVLDFESERDRIIATLDGTYIPFLLPSAGADIIIGADMGLEARVMAWRVSTGERIELGVFRDCGRQADMARLSRDGSTLVIGCDQGLDIWRVR